MEFICLVFTRTPGGLTVGDSGLCCCVPCLSSAIISLCLLVPLFFSFMLIFELPVLRQTVLKEVPEAKTVHFSVPFSKFGRRKLSVDEYLTESKTGVTLLSPK